MLIVKLHLTVFSPSLPLFFFLFFFFRLSKSHRCHGVNCRRLKSSPITPLCSSSLLHPPPLSPPPHPAVCPTNLLDDPRCRAHRDDDIFGLISSCFDNARARLLTSHIIPEIHRAASAGRRFRIRIFRV